MKLKKIPPMVLVIFAVCMVSYSGPMIKGALNAGAAPASVAFLRMLASAILLSPIEIAQMRKHRIPLRVSRREGVLAVVSALFLPGIISRGLPPSPAPAPSLPLRWYAPSRCSWRFSAGFCSTRPRPAARCPAQPLRFWAL